MFDHQTRRALGGPFAGLDDVTALELDPGSFVLTAFGRSNSGAIRGERAIARPVSQLLLQDLRNA